MELFQALGGRGGNVKKQCQSLEILRWKAGYWGTTVQARTLSCVYSCLCSCWAAATYFVYLQKLASSRNLRTTQTRHEAGKWWTVGACRCFVWSLLGSKPVQCRGAPAAPIRNTALWIVTSQSSDVSHHLLPVGDPMVSLGRVWISLSLPGPGGDHVMASASADCRSVTRV